MKYLIHVSKAGKSAGLNWVIIDENRKKVYAKDVFINVPCRTTHVEQTRFYIEAIGKLKKNENQEVFIDGLFEDN